MSKTPPVNLAGMDRAFFEALDPAALVELLSAACAGDRAGGTPGAELNQLLAAALVGWSFRSAGRGRWPGERQQDAARLAAGRPVAAPDPAVRAQAGQAARRQGGVAERAAGGGGDAQPLSRGVRDLRHRLRMV